MTDAKLKIDISIANYLEAICVAYAQFVFEPQVLPTRTVDLIYVYVQVHAWTIYILSNEYKNKRQSKCI
jgi:hypothetical protein